MRKDNICGSVRADTPKIEVTQRRAGGFVQGRPQARALLDEVVLRISVPRYPETVNVEEFVASCNLLLGGYIVWIIVEELGQVVVVNLVGESVLGGDEDILKQALLAFRNVYEPAEVQISYMEKRKSPPRQY
jgi:hypothetical protein